MSIKMSTWVGLPRPMCDFLITLISFSDCFYWSSSNQNSPKGMTSLPHEHVHRQILKNVAIVKIPLTWTMYVTCSESDIHQYFYLRMVPRIVYRGWRKSLPRKAHGTWLSVNNWTTVDVAEVVRTLNQLYEWDIQVKCEKIGPSQSILHACQRICRKMQRF